MQDKNSNTGETLKIPDHIIIKRLIFEKGQSDSYIHELEFKVKTLKSENDLLRHSGLTPAEKEKLREEYKMQHGESIKALKTIIDGMKKERDRMLVKLNEKE